MTKWDHIILEGYCMYDSMKNKMVTSFRLISWEPYRTEKLPPAPNPIYINGTRPAWCKKKYPKNAERTPEYRCLEEKCPYFQFTDAETKDYNLFRTVWNKRTEAKNDRVSKRKLAKRDS